MRSLLEDAMYERDPHCCNKQEGAEGSERFEEDRTEFQETRNETEYLSKYMCTVLTRRMV